MRYIISLGSSVGKIYINNALEELNNHCEIVYYGSSKIYYNKSVGTVRNCLFYNCAAAVSSELEPQAFFRELRAIEQKLGRIRTYRNAARTLDIDIILSFPFSYNNNSLIIPHGAIFERSFFVYCAIEVIQFVGWPVLYSLCAARARLGISTMSPCAM